MFYSLYFFLLMKVKPPLSFIAEGLFRYISFVERRFVIWGISCPTMYVVLLDPISSCSLKTFLLNLRQMSFTSRRT